MLTAAYKWNTIKTRISLKWIQKRNVPKTNVDYYISFYIKKIFFDKKNCTGRCREVILAVGGALIRGRCRCREV